MHRTLRPRLRPALAGAPRRGPARWLRVAARSGALPDLLGNAAFLIGSLLFLTEAAQTLGVWLFVAGSAAMLRGSLRRVARAVEGDD